VERVSYEFKRYKVDQTNGFAIEVSVETDTSHNMLYTRVCCGADQDNVDAKNGFASKLSTCCHHCYFCCFLLLPCIGS
jgi:hypothetical protein